MGSSFLLHPEIRHQPSPYSSIMKVTMILTACLATLHAAHMGTDAPTAAAPTTAAPTTAAKQECSAEVATVCCDGGDFVTTMAPTTAAPTAAPTVAPTAAPTAAPTTA